MAILGMAILGTAILGTNQLQPVEWEGVAYCSSVGISGNIPRFVYVDLIGKTIQVILELNIYMLRVLPRFQNLQITSKQCCYNASIFNLTQDLKFTKF